MNLLAFADRLLRVKDCSKTGDEFADVLLKNLISLLITFYSFQ